MGGRGPGRKLRLPKPLFERVKVPLLLLAYIGVSEWADPFPFQVSLPARLAVFALVLFVLRRAAELYQKVGPEYRSTVIQPALFQRTKAAIGQVKAEDFAISRAKLAATIQVQLTRQISAYGIVVEFVNIEDAIFDPAFVQAVKEKVIAEQEAAEQERLIVAQEAIKEQTIIKARARARSVQIEAQAQADANRMIARSLTPEVLRWKWLVAWNGTLPSTLVDGQGATLLLDGTYP